MDKVEVSHEDKLATITMKEGAELSEERLKKAFDGSQFTVEKFEKEGAEDAEASAQAIHKATITGMN